MASSSHFNPRYSSLLIQPTVRPGRLPAVPGQCDLGKPDSAWTRPYGADQMGTDFPGLATDRMPTSTLDSNVPPGSSGCCFLSLLILLAAITGLKHPKTAANLNRRYGISIRSYAGRYSPDKGSGASRSGVGSQQGPVLVLRHPAAGHKHAPHPRDIPLPPRDTPTGTEPARLSQGASPFILRRPDISDKAQPRREGNKGIPHRKDGVAFSLR
ncbi:nucleic acid-templated transcription [Branchiostoma belcheri]|nr:nucleic acid-templated transcription [Branchiostoma belcheri]